jgi:hypothetical protein
MTKKPFEELNMSIMNPLHKNSATMLSSVTAQENKRIGRRLGVLRNGLVLAGVLLANQSVAADNGGINAAAKNGKTVQAPVTLNKSAALAAAAKLGKVGVAVGALPVHNRTQVTNQTVEAGAATAVVSLASQVDLDAQITAYRDQGQQISRGPKLVTGQGPDLSNYTFIKVLGTEGITKLCFLAFPPAVRGGVDVAVVHATQGGAPIIVAAPLLDASSREVRFFTQGGALLRAVVVPRGEPPFALATWRKDNGQELVAVTSASSANAEPILLLDADGNNAGEVPLPAPPPVVAGTRSLTTVDGKLALSVTGQSSLALWDGAKWRTRRLGATATTGNSYAGRSRSEVVVPGGSEVLSTITRFTTDNAKQTVDVGVRENLFWIAPQDGVWPGGDPQGTHYEPTIAASDFATNRYLKRGRFNHARVEPFSPQYGKRFETSTNYADWTGGDSIQKVSRFIDAYDTNLPTIWQPTTTTRWFPPVREQLGGYRDGETGLPKYMTLGRFNTEPGYAEGKNEFVIGSYHYWDQPYAYCHWTYTLRAHLRALAQKHRTNPEHFIAIEPVHEMEVISEQGRDGSIGDYNPAGIRGFYQYLRCTYPDLASINRVLAPRSPPTSLTPREI